MEAKEKLNRAKIQIQMKHPFYSYLSLYLKFREAKEGELSENAGMGVNIRGDVIYSKAFVDGLTSDELEGVIAHEILHLVFLHLLRRGKREAEPWNIACDLCINTILNKEGFSLPSGGCLANYDDEFKIGNLTIENVSKKTAEEIYDDFPESMKQKGAGNKAGDGNSEMEAMKGFDDHIEGDGEGKALEESKKAEYENDWLSKADEAYETAEQRGKAPSGIGRLIKKIKKQEVNWRAYLQRYLQSAIPRDFSWARRSKKSVSCGIYLPRTIKENIDVCIGIDTSGSIQQEEMTKFISEMVGMGKAFKECIKMRVITHDCKVYDDYEISNGSIKKILALQIRGGGGTAHKPLFDYVKDNIPDCKVLISFTDGYSDLDSFDMNKYNFAKLFVITKGGSDEQVKKELVIKLKEY